MVLDAASLSILISGASLAVAGLSYAHSHNATRRDNAKYEFDTIIGNSCDRLFAELDEIADEYSNLAFNANSLSDAELTSELNLIYKRHNQWYAKSANILFPSNLPNVFNQLDGKAIEILDEAIELVEYPESANDIGSALYGMHRELIDYLVTARTVVVKKRREHGTILGHIKSVLPMPQTTPINHLK